MFNWIVGAVGFYLLVGLIAAVLFYVFYRKEGVPREVSRKRALIEAAKWPATAVMWLWETVAHFRR